MNKAELLALERDAARYRWLRDNPRADVRIVGIGKGSGERLDIILDAERAKETK